MSGFWKVGEEGVGDMIWQVSNESYEVKVGEEKSYTDGGHKDFNDLLSFQLLDFLDDWATLTLQRSYMSTLAKF